jgi:hypothetical protein
MPRGGDRSLQLSPGKKMGRPPKPQIPLDDGPTKKGIASQVLAMDGPPDHARKCSCDACAHHRKNCKCVEQCGDCHKLEENCECEKYRPITIRYSLVTL